jgi:hypothetical protein
VQRHAQQACGDQNGGGDHGDAEVEQLEQQRESEQDSSDDRNHDAYLSTKKPDTLSVTGDTRGRPR